MRRVPFFDAYKRWRNRARNFNLESIVKAAVDVLGEPAPDPVTNFARAPWIILLMVKWACQDRYPGSAHLPLHAPAMLGFRGGVIQPPSGCVNGAWVDNSEALGWRIPGVSL